MTWHDHAEIISSQCRSTGAAASSAAAAATAGVTVASVSGKFIHTVLKEFDR